MSNIPIEDSDETVSFVFATQSNIATTYNNLHIISKAQHFIDKW